MEQESPEEFARRVLRMRDRLAPQFPDMDPGDMLLIIESILSKKPRRWLLRSVGRGAYAL